MVRTRFAPSPTGDLHIGSARVALYCWLYARKHRGQFILRIEDTDVERSTEQSKLSILRGMEWLELEYDEGPFYQSQRYERYQAVIEQLLSEGKAYRCYCNRDRLENLRAAQMERKEKPRYDGHCRNRELYPEGQDFVVRFKTPLEGEVQFNDCVHGLTTFKNSELDDLIIARSDGMPTYNFTVVVDDSDMRVTHVIRGDDHLNNTPRQINILKALGATIPEYAHLPMILGSDAKKLSKRHGAVSVLQYRDEGILPDALLNYLVRLGWSHGDQEIFSREELIQLFDIHDLNHSAAAFNPEKLLWLNQHYLKTGDVKKTARHLAWHMQQLQIDIQHGPALEELIPLQAERCKTLKEMAEKSRFFYQDIVCDKQAITAESKQALQALISYLEQLDNWSDSALHDVIQKTAEQQSLKLGQLAQPLRQAVTGGTVSPPINSTLRLLGKPQTLVRLQRLFNE